MESMNGRKKTAQVVLLLAVPVLAIAGCGESVQTPGTDTPWTTYESDLPRNQPPATTETELDALVRGNHEFAIDLYGQFRTEDGNLLISPVSIRIAFAMAYGGAKGQTAAEIADVMHFPFGGEALHDAMNALDLALARRNLPATPDEDPVELHLVNAFWGQEGEAFRPDYLDLLAVYYGSAMRALDFVHEPEESRSIINAWVAERTRQRILKLLPPGSIDPLTVAVLTNALYFKAPWADPFPEYATSDGPFHLKDGTLLTVPMMHATESHRYAAGDGWQALEMDYRGEELSMVFLLPDKGTFDEFEAGLDADRLETMLGSLEDASVTVTIPKFTFGSESMFLNDPLIALRMPSPFVARSADFSGIWGEPGEMWISSVYHKTFIAVDEKGTEAAAATAIVFERLSILPGEPAVFTADRPFMFLIRDRMTGALLFFGRVLDPTAE
ncbi:MAG: serpin family protein [Candidatus Eisenbacteria sp.]|nr:serpin family protein [Candidatus Eisenbacteria bacterium]